MKYAWVTGWLSVSVGCAGALAVTVPHGWVYVLFGAFLAFCNALHTWMAHAGPGFAAYEPPMSLDQFLLSASKLIPGAENARTNPKIFDIPMYVANPTIQPVANVFMARLNDEYALVIEAATAKDTHGQDSK